MLERSCVYVKKILFVKRRKEMKMVRTQKGFTLIELVIVIVILGILAAVAIPKYVNLQKEARSAVVNGMTGGLKSARLVAKAKYMAVGDMALNTVDMDGTAVTVIPGAGVPTADQTGIVSALTDTAGFVVTPAGVSPNSTVTFWPTNSVGNATCGTVYSGPTGTVTSDTTGC
jgi:MSHA pilin protein MshA